MRETDSLEAIFFKRLHVHASMCMCTLVPFFLH